MPTGPKKHQSMPSQGRPKDRRPGPRRRGYDRAWDQLSAYIRRMRPVCEQCRRAPSQQIDHRIALAKGGTNDEANLVALCASCHSKKTVAVDGGFGRQTRTGGQG